MDNFDDLIEKYRHELIEFSKNNPVPQDAVSVSNDVEDVAPVTSENFNTNNDALGDAVSVASTNITTEPIAESEGEVKTNTNDTYEAPKFADYNEFLKNNPQNGSLKVQVFAANQAFPIPNARVTIVLELVNEPREMYDGLTDINGIIDNIKLPAPDAEKSQSPSTSSVLPYSTYTTYVEHPDFVKEKFTNVPVFPGIKSIQGVELISLVNNGNQPERIVQNENESFSRLKGVE